jgi:hypothetical protein
MASNLEEVWEKALKSDGSWTLINFLVDALKKNASCPAISTAEKVHWTHNINI